MESSSTCFRFLSLISLISSLISLYTSLSENQSLVYCCLFFIFCGFACIYILYIPDLNTVQRQHYFYIFQMKIFKFPGARITNIDRDHNKSPKLSKSKKYGSLDLTYFFSNKNKQLERVYRAISYDKKTRNKSTNSTKSTNELKHQFKPYQTNYKIKNPKKQLNLPEKKIFLQTEKKGKYLYNDIKFNIELLSERLSRCLQVKSQKLFTEQYQQAINFLSPETDTNKQNNQHLLQSLIQKLCLCEQRKSENKLQVQIERTSTAEKQKTNLNVEIKRLKIKEEAQNNQISKLNQRIMDMTREIKRIRDRSCVNYSTQTQNNATPGILIQDQDNPQGQAMQEFPKLIQQLRVLQAKENHMNILVGQLQREGVNLQKIYNKGLKHLNKAQSQQPPSSDSQPSHLQSHPNKSPKQNPNSNPSCQIKNKHDSDADDSIIDEMDALSFNYENKEVEMEAYTPRRVYVCKKKLDDKMRKQLQLNFQCLYDEDEEEYEENTEGCPTI